MAAASISFDSDSAESPIPKNVSAMHIDPIWEDPPKGPQKEKSGENEKDKGGKFIPFIPQKTPPSTTSTPNTSITDEPKQTRVKKVKSGKTDVTTLRKGQALYDAIGKCEDNLISGAKAFYNITHNPISIGSLVPPCLVN